MNEFNTGSNDNRNSRRPQSTNPGAVMRTVFGIFMIIIYVGMGILLLINFFNWDGDWSWTRYVVGIALIIYGVWRAYRQIKGIDDPYRDR